MTQDSDPSNAARGSGPWKWVALGCGGCLVFSTVALVALVWLIGRTMQFAIGPEGVNPEQAPFAYTIPGQSEGVLSMNMFGMEITQITSTDTPPSVLLTMGRLPRYLQNSADQASLLESFQEGMIGDETYQFSPPRTEERTLCDTAVPVILQTGDYQENQSTYPATSLMAAVDYNGRTQFVWILAHGDAATANADQVFSSLACQ
ncbi:MAG: hypothetical protein ACHWZW_03175 [Spirulina sp.]